MDPPHLIRPFDPGDTPVLARLYGGAIEHLGPAAYSPEQVVAWAAHGRDLAAFEAWLAGTQTFVAVDARDRPVGFAGLEPPGRIASLFVAPPAMRRGIGRALAARVLDEIRARGVSVATAEASEFSRPLFEGLGFHVVEVEHTTVRGVAFSRYRMRRVTSV